MFAYLLIYLLTRCERCPLRLSCDKVSEFSASFLSRCLCCDSMAQSLWVWPYGTLDLKWRPMEMVVEVYHLLSLSRLEGLGSVEISPSEVWGGSPPKTMLGHAIVCDFRRVLVDFGSRLSGIITPTRNTLDCDQSNYSTRIISTE